MNRDTLDDYNKIALVQDDQLGKGRKALAFGASRLKEFDHNLDKLKQNSDELDRMVDECLDMTLALSPEDVRKNAPEFLDVSALETLLPHTAPIHFDNSRFDEIAASLDTIRTDDNFLDNIDAYAKQYNIDVSSSALALLNETELRQLKANLDQLSYRKPQCDKYDYMIAGTCGVLGGLIDVFLVGSPGSGSLITAWSDDMAEKSVCKIASFLGWEGPRDGKDAAKSAIGFLERKYLVNYDFGTTKSTGDIIKNMRTKNHHIKSLSHSPDLIGLLFSILDQFTETAHFVDNGVIKIVHGSSNNKFKLQGKTFAAKIACGFFNYLGHMISDVAGSSGAAGRGTGLPIPFFSLLQFINVGEFGQYHQTFATQVVKVFEQGYDFRHGMAMTIPVIVTEIFIRIMWMLKARFYHKKDWKDCFPSTDIPEVQHMIFVGFAAFCAIDGIDAAIRGKGELVTTLLNSNLIAWVRFSFSAMKEVHMYLRAGHLDDDKIDAFLKQEYQRLLVC